MTVSAIYSSAPGEDPGKLGPNEFTAGSDLMLNCAVEGDSGSLTYAWSVTGNERATGCKKCDIDTSSSTSTLTVGAPSLFSYYAGNYTCDVSEKHRSESSNSDNFLVTVVGELSALSSLPRDPTHPYL